MKTYKFSKNKQHILDTAYALFDEKGYRKTTMRDISTKANVSLGAITHHFNKKADIAKVLSQTYNKIIYTQIRNIYSKLDLDTIEADTVYLTTSVIIGSTIKKRLDFMYDLSQENLLTDIMLDHIFMQFARKNEYLKMHLDNQTLNVYSLFYIGMYQQLICGIKEGIIKDVPEAIRIFNVHHLLQLGFSKNEIDCILDVAIPISFDIKITETDVFDIRLDY
ncbi:TetR/AcrR family transcriptional regulator [Alkalibacter mobilis]|uniref:TetR/AcrR family transcriptional regulator n=1 Tax=Alkalibacter mobilis TaxID=2787712 RepID=UPI00189D0BA2|nr:helix-turn-helix domain-containing protein [Alkalibacter mobilis]MBF7097271.1 helix-turn-helix transcriptional regulator [Alkalibacter mobilis]